jgi:hypothetical protein
MLLKYDLQSTSSGELTKWVIKVKTNFPAAVVRTGSNRSFVGIKILRNEGSQGEVEDENCRMDRLDHPNIRLARSGISYQCKHKYFEG